MKVRQRIAAFVCGLFLSAGLVFAGLETGTYISDLVATNPLSSDLASTSDDHLRLIKGTLKNTFPNISGAVTSTHTELNLLDGLSGTVWTSGNDGAGSGLDADTLDSLSSAAFARLSASNVFTNIGSGQSSAIVAASDDPHIALYDSNGTANRRLVYARIASDRFLLYNANDADSAATIFFDVTLGANGGTPSLINLQATEVQVNGAKVPRTVFATFSGDDSCSFLPGTLNQGISGCTRNSEGSYTITLSQSYSSNPACFVTPRSSPVRLQVSASGGSSVSVATISETTGSNLDADFALMCVG